MSDFVRVRDKSTGLEYSVRHPNLAKVTVIDEPADDANGDPRPAGPNTSVTKTAKPKKRAAKPRKRAAAKPKTTVAEPVAAKPKSASGTEPAKNPEGDSK